MARIITVDFEGVEVGGRGAHIPEGDYGIKVKEIKTKKGEDSRKNYLLITFTVTQGNKKGIGKNLMHSCSLQKQSLWNFRNLLESLGKQVPPKAVKLDLDKMIDMECAGTVTDEEYEGKKKSVIAAFFPLEDLGNTSEDGSELEETEEEEETPAEEEPAKKDKGKDKKKKKETVEEEEESEEEDLFS